MATTIGSKHIWLITTIKAAGKISLKDIQKKYRDWAGNDIHEEMAVRTFHRHRNNILLNMGIDILCDRVTNEYYISNEGEMENEVVEWMLNSFALNELLHEGKQLKDRVLLENIPSGAKYLKLLIEAMKENRNLLVSYKKFADSEAFDVKLSPYALKIDRQRWYLVALDSTSKIKTYALDRMHHVEVTEETFKLPSSFCAGDYFKNSFGIFMHENDPIEHIKIKVSSQQSNYIRTLPLHSSQQEEKHDDYSIFEYDMNVDIEFEQALMKYGPEIEVLEPIKLREKMAENARNMLKAYEK
ncbi:MAG: WYL domain-containing protein [Paludibacteraceae bacterium]|nr:WYL domain-containing protein [Paludibacteraceae bacterium]